MPNEDALRWDERYEKDTRFASFERPRPFLVENAGLLPTSGLALDAAMGLGGNARFLQARGLKVIGVDISSVALHRAKERSPELMAVLADLTRFYLPNEAFDVIVNFYYLQRDLWPQYQRALKPGGWLVIETLTKDMLAHQPDIEPRYLLGPSELRRAFSEMEILVYREGWEERDTGFPRAVAGLVARKRSG